MTIEPVKVGSSSEHPGSYGSPLFSSMGTSYGLTPIVYSTDSSSWAEESGEFSISLVLNDIDVPANALFSPLTQQGCETYDVVFGGGAVEEPEKFDRENFLASLKPATDHLKSDSEVWEKLLAEDIELDAASSDGLDE